MYDSGFGDEDVLWFVYDVIHAIHTGGAVRVVIGPSISSFLLLRLARHEIHIASYECLLLLKARVAFFFVHRVCG